MSMFKGVKPSAQPRTLRTIAETKGTTPAGYEGASEPVPMQPYKDVDPGHGSLVRETNAATPHPFGNLKGGH
jgi:hypothetical protein